MSAQAVHLQYNSPMGLYNRETAEEQFHQQIGGNSPIPMPAADKHFDPNKSATLRYIKEGEHSNFGANFAEKIAAAEAPNVPYSQEPHWARYAREKSERARSRTPADPLQHRYSGSRSPSQPYREHHETTWEHAEKTRTYTNAVHPSSGPAYYQYQHPGQRQRHYSTGSNYPDRGYECGGMDYTKGLPIEKGSSGYYEHVSRRQEHEQKCPGYEMGGTDFGKGYVAPGPYHGHGPDPPRLRPRYSADPHSQVMSFVAPNLDAVDANLLVGDTLSNQKIRHEVRQMNQSEFGTTFAPPSGFKRDHVTVRQSSPPPEPVTYSTTCASNYARRSASAPRSSAPAQAVYSSAPAEQTNVWRQRQADTDREVTVERLLTGEATERRPLNPTIPYWSHSALRKHANWRNRSDPRLDRPEVYTSEPNWSRTVQQRKGAWENKAFDTEARVNLPASAKIPVQAPPAWHQTAHQKHQVWQNVADQMQGGQMDQQQQQQSYQSYQTHASSQQYSQPAPVSYASGNNAMNIANTGFNQNQLDYLASHQKNYNAGQQYSPRTTSYTTTTATSYPGGYNQEQRSHYKSSSSTREERSIPVQPVQTGFQESSFHKSSSSTQETRAVPVQPVQDRFQQSYQKTSSSTQETTSAPLQPIQTNFQESFQRSSSSTQNETRTAPRFETGGLLQTQGNLQKDMLHSPGSYKSFHSSHYSKQETTTSATGPDRYVAPQITTTTPVTKNTSYSYSSQTVNNPNQPVQIQQSSTTSHSSNQQAIPVGYAPPRPEGGTNYHAESHHSYKREEQESRPVSQLSQYSQSSYNRKREERTETRTTVPVIPPITSSSAAQNQAGAQTAYSKIEMTETLPRGSLANTQSNTHGGYRDQEGHDVYYKKDLQTTSDPGKDCSLLKEEEKRVVETPLEPGVISRHVTTKYYKKKTVTDTTTTTAPEIAP